MKVQKESLDLIERRITELKQILPEVFIDGKIDVDRLREALGEYVEIGGERYSFAWAGRTQAIRLRDRRSKATLTPSRKESIDFDKTKNILVEGENLEVLKLLQKSYQGKVKMIYIDPPYNTGKDFIYKDDFSDSLRNYLRYTGQITSNGERASTNPETSGRYHSNWLSMMYPRLFLARNLLSEDGVIFVSIDDHEAYNLRIIMNEIYGEENFVADVVVVNNLKGRNDRKYIATAHERLLIYVKSQEFEEYGLELSDEQLAEYGEEDELGKYRYLGLRKRGGADTRAERRKMYFPLYVDPRTNQVSLVQDKDFSIEVLPKKSDGTDGCWRWGQSTVKLRLSSLVGLPVGKEGRYGISEKDYLETNGEIKRLKPKSIMLGSNYSTDGATKSFRTLFPEAVEFSNPKPVPFLKDIVAYSTVPEEENIILDFFAGAGTTAHAILELNAEDGGNRKFILVQLPEPTSKDSEAYKAGYKTIADICKERVRRAIKEIKEKHSHEEPIGETADLGFKVFRLSESNSYVWDDASVNDEETLTKQIKDSAKGASSADKEALLFELMLREGFRLDSNIEQIKNGKNKFYKIGDSEHVLWMCFDESIEEESVEKLVLNKDDKLIVLDSALTDTQKVNLTRKARIETV